MSEERHRARRERPGRWSRVRGWLSGRKSEPVSQFTYVPSTPENRFSTPSKGDAFDFEVVIRWSWTGRAYDQDSLIEDVGPHGVDVWEQIAVATRCILRCYPPHQPAEAESTLNKKLAEIARDGQISSTTANWAARAEVSLHDDVRRLQQAAWTDRLQWAAHDELARTTIGDLRERAELWKGMLGSVGIGVEKRELEGADDLPDVAPYLGRYLVRLAVEPSRAADVVDALSEGRDAKDRELLEAVVDAVGNFDSANLLEFETAHDSALRRLMKWAGLPLPGGLEAPAEETL